MVGTLFASLPYSCEPRWFTHKVPVSSKGTQVYADAHNAQILDPDPLEEHGTTPLGGVASCCIKTVER